MQLRAIFCASQLRRIHFTPHSRFLEQGKSFQTLFKRGSNVFSSKKVLKNRSQVDLSLFQLAGVSRNTGAHVFFSYSFSGFFFIFFHFSPLFSVLGILGFAILHA
jgi:hypothetical protein